MSTGIWKKLGRLLQAEVSQAFKPEFREVKGPGPNGADERDRRRTPGPAATVPLVAGVSCIPRTGRSTVHFCYFAKDRLSLGDCLSFPAIQRCVDPTQSVQIHSVGWSLVLRQVSGSR